MLEHDTALAEQLARKSDVPLGFLKKTLTCLAWDNNDFGEETLSGKGTTHNTNGIIVQRVSPETVPCDVSSSRTNTVEEESQKPSKAKRSSTLHFIEEPIPDYHVRKKSGLPLCLLDTSEQLSISKSDTEGETHVIDLGMTVCKMHVTQPDSPLPGWTDFNMLLHNDHVPEKSRVGYLPIINASLTQLKTVNAVFEKSIAVADELELELPLVFMFRCIHCQMSKLTFFCVALC